MQVSTLDVRICLYNRQIMMSKVGARVERAKFEDGMSIEFDRRMFWFKLYG